MVRGSTAKICPISSNGSTAVKSRAAGPPAVLAWAWPAATAGGEAYRAAILWGQTADRIVTSFAHAHPVWWYLPWLMVLFAPWSLMPWLWTGLRLAWRRRDSGQRLCVTWLVAVFLLLSLVSGKQVKYLLPLLPAFALLLSRTLSQLPERPVTQRPWLPASVLAAPACQSKRGPQTQAPDKPCPKCPPVGQPATPAPAAPTTSDGGRIFASPLALYNADPALIVSADVIRCQFPTGRLPPPVDKPWRSPVD